MFPQRYFRLLCFEVPTRSFDRGFRHPVTAHRFHQLKYLCGAFDFRAENHRREKVSQRRPGAVRPLVAVKRALAAGAFSPTFGAVSVRQTREDNAAFSGATEAGFEKVNERQANFAQFDRLDKQSKKAFLRERHYALLYGGCNLSTD